jgi:translation initiation factor 5B
LQMVKEAVFNAKSPIIIGVNVVEGVLKVGTPLAVPVKDSLRLGIVQSIEINKKPVKEARAKDGSIAIKIQNDGSVCYGRHFNDTDQIASLITRDTIDTLKEHFRDEMTKEDWQTVLKLKKIYGIA